MIVFWRLFLAMFAADFLLFHKILRIQQKNHTRATCVRTAFFIVFGLLLCWHYLTLDWPFLGLWPMRGWMCLLLMAVLYAGIHQFFDFGGEIKGGHLLTFTVKNAYLFLILMLCAPLKALSETGHFFAQPITIFLAGLVLVTRLVEWFTTSLEADLYGGDVQRTFDEQWMTMMVRTIFYLIMLLPGVRWLILLIVWTVACLYARRIRLMDVSSITFYVGFFASVVLGFLVRLRFYLLG